MGPRAPAELVARILVGAALGGIIGYERDRHGRPVGLRTHLIVAMTAATFMVVSAHFVYFQGYGKDDLTAVDASRIAASVVSGIGFLAGGAILRTGATVQGLTTAAGLWLVTAIGLAAGAGMYVVAIAVTLMGVIALTVLRRFEDKNDSVTRQRVSIVLGAEGRNVGQVMEAVGALGMRVNKMEYERRFDEKRRLTVTFEVLLPDTIGVGGLVDRIEQLPDVLRVQVQHL
ncbi:MgtC/SapB family protein [Chondromyces apiculatus]|uniref:Mg(2+) transport ATPase protein C n=1 Tax=Chondromyces apiculatus DSM 436 TaxID=1192034 RepID=A0A017TAV5_9BACT|nr:MgtC/SapB family protein [Chondromyces apiculatus]EYF05955.1 Mg(2+) transport ATPase protein C [Chondromyces apiculatus DSM 436]